MKKKNRLWTIFISTFRISAFTFGGGYVIIPLLDEQFVKKLKWISEEEMLDLVALAQTSPGAVAVNASMLIGYKINGLKGATMAVLGTIIPPMLIISIVSLFYEAFKTNLYVAGFLKGMNAGVCAVILNVEFDLVKKIIKDKQVEVLFVMLIALLLVLVYKVNIIVIIFSCAIYGLLRGLIYLKGGASNVN